VQQEPRWLSRGLCPVARGSDWAGCAVAERRVKVDELTFYKLTTAHGQIFETEAVWRQKLAAVQAEAQRAVDAKKATFEAQLEAVAQTAGVARTDITQWDVETCELVITLP
jgi:hypothetical protein